MCVVPTVTFDRLFALLVLGHGRRRLLWFEVTRHPTAKWLARQIIEAITPRSPWQNGIAERYAAYYNQARTHLALHKDAPINRAAQRSGKIVAIPVLAGLHHQYVRM